MLSFIRNINKKIEKKSKLDTHWEIPLPTEILQHGLFGYLELDEASILARASTPFAKSCQKQFEVARLLQHLVRGEQDEAKTMLQKDRSLLLQKGNVNDLSSRKFYQITAFQYALWALDRHMWEMILEYLPENEAAKQLEELETMGVEYEKETPGDSKAEKHHFDFSPLIAVLQDYVDPLIQEIGIAEAAWYQKCRRRAKNVPAHGVSMPGGSVVYPTPAFKNDIAGHLEFYNYVSGAYSSWFLIPVSVLFCCSARLRTAERLGWAGAGGPRGTARAGERDALGR